MSRPLIAMTCHYDVATWGLPWTADAVITHAVYPKAVRQVGGRVVLVPPDPDCSDLVDRVDAIVITGGQDLDPLHYGQEAHPTVDAPDSERDAAEFALFRSAWERDMPILGVCRGLQVMAVGLGGALVQHLPEETELVHQMQPGAFVQHQVRILSGTLTAEILGAGAIDVNSSHHQAIADPGGLTATGFAEDGVVEACEDPTRAFCMGVQWHPEYPDQPTGPTLFGALVRAAAVYREQRPRS
jgi:putative glutamine amidotransferase